MQATKTEMKYDIGSVKVKNKETGVWEVVATFPHQTSTKLNNNSLALKFIKMLKELEQEQ